VNQYQEKAKSHQVTYLLLRNEDFWNDVY
jgi:hypothetical protein